MLVLKLDVIARATLKFGGERRSSHLGGGRRRDEVERASGDSRAGIVDGRQRVGECGFVTIPPLLLCLRWVLHVRVRRLKFLSRRGLV